MDLEDYKNFVAILYDHQTQIFVDKDGFTADYLYNKMTIKKDSINLELKDNSQKLNLGTLTADQQAILGNHWFEWFDKFICTLLTPTSLIGNLGAPVLKPQLDSLFAEYQTIRETFLSKNVNIVDNNDVEKLS
jgi:hypothetical protein